jgi:hypothetical protein
MNCHGINTTASDIRTAPNFNDMLFSGIATAGI